MNAAFRFRPFVLVACAFVNTATLAQTFQIVVKDGDVVPSVGGVTLINNLSINNSGTWFAEVDTDNADTTVDGALITNGLAVHLQENQLLPGLPAGMVRLSSFDSVNIDNAGRFGGNLFLRGATTTTDSGIYQDANLVMQESFISTSPTFSSGTPYLGWFETRSNNLLQHLLIASLDDAAIATTVDRAVVILQTDAAGNLVSETVVAKEGDILPGHTQAAADFGTSSGSFAFNDSGTAMFLVDGNGTTADDFALYLGMTKLAQESGVSPVAGRTWGISGLGSSKMHLNNSGGYVHTGTLDASDTTTDAVIIKNGAKFRQEGDTLASIGGVFTFTSFGSNAPQIDDSGNVLWFGDWNDADASKDTGLFLNDRLLVQEGVTQIEGNTVFSLASGEDAFKMSDDGEFAIFECVLATPSGNVDAAVVIGVNRVDHTTASVGPGSTIGSSTSLDALSTSLDDMRWNIRPGAILVATQDPVKATITFHLPFAAVTTLEVIVESKASVSGIRQKVEVKQGASSTFTSLETFSPLPFGAAPDRLTALSVPTPNAHINSTNNNAVVVQLLAKNTTAVLVYPWQYQIDRCYLRFIQ